MVVIASSGCIKSISILGHGDGYGAFEWYGQSQATFIHKSSEVTIMGSRSCLIFLCSEFGICRSPASPASGSTAPKIWSLDLAIVFATWAKNIRRAFYSAKLYGDWNLRCWYRMP